MKAAPESAVPAGAITISHEAVVAAYQDRLAALTDENIKLGIIIQQQQREIAALRELVAQPTLRPVRVPSEPVDCAAEGTRE